MSKKTGDTAIFDYGYISENQIKSSGIKHGTERDVYGHINKCYYIDTFYQDNKYCSLIATWDLKTSINNGNSSSKRVISFEFQKKYNALIYYYPCPRDEIVIVYADDDHTYINTSNTSISLFMVGCCNPAYIQKCKFSKHDGGTSGRGIPNAGTIVGHLGKIGSALSDTWSILSDTADVISNYNFNNSTKEYEMYSIHGNYTKQVGSKYSPVLYKKYSLLEVDAVLNNVYVSSDNKIFFQIRTMILSSPSANQNVTVNFGGSQQLV